MKCYRGLREKFLLPDTLFGPDGELLFHDLAKIRQLIHQVNQQRPEDEHVFLGELRASALLQKVNLHMLERYEELVLGRAFRAAVESLKKRPGAPALFAAMEDVVATYPPESVFQGRQKAGEHLHSVIRKQPRIEKILQDAIVLMLATENPANRNLTLFFGTSHLQNKGLFDATMDALEWIFKKYPPFGPSREDLFEFLRGPFKASPDDLYVQLEYVLTHWRQWLPQDMVSAIMISKDLMKEDRIPVPGDGSPPPIVPAYGKKPNATMFIGKSGFDAVRSAASDYDEEERFTPDTHWMPRVVMIAKNTYVWLDQLSAKYNRDIRRLDQIPDEELDRLAKWNFNGLWLIGVWERSQASGKIKHMMGNPDAISSAYALYDYEIAHDLGGEEAYRNLNARALRRGIRLASDMVPNHTGVFSRWVIEHPDHFIQRPSSPFPGYSFNGPDLSDHPGIEIRIEDGYYDRSDAAVVFQRIDRHNNDTRYIYHGNDGTMMPWNDTAQLDMLKANVREAVMEKIFDVARRFSIIRFDAAMTLAKKHFSRLWYPEPGSGGDIPSRAEYAMTRKDFDTMFPLEFWREVVDRINEELPETLLLAEAFWFMEGYFVRTLGMHRVYNSAFMHMLKNEENEKYRDLITNTLEFEPEILKRYVNFMSNPDEETAIQQFGTGDKYFGICVLMNTLPGLPMFAHGQIEGFTEKYGMEYQRAYYREEPREWFVERHEREIFPLAGKRYLFSEVEHFQLYDYIDRQERVNENVFAFTNRHGEEVALVLFNNKYERANGHIHKAAPRLKRNTGSQDMETTFLAGALNMDHADDAFYVAREHISGQEFLFSGKDIHARGLHWPLEGFGYRVFLSFTRRKDADGTLRALYRTLAGSGIDNVDRALALQKLSPVHQAFVQLVDEDLTDKYLAHIVSQGTTRRGATGRDTGFSETITRWFNTFANKAFAAAGLKDGEAGSATSLFSASIERPLHALEFIRYSSSWITPVIKGTAFHKPEDLVVLSDNHTYRENATLLIAHYALKAMQETLAGQRGFPSGSGSNPGEDGLWNRLMMEWPLREVLRRGGRSEADIARDVLLVRLLLRHGDAVFSHATAAQAKRGRPNKRKLPDHIRENICAATAKMLDDPEVQQYLGVNEYKGVVYYSKEGFEQLSVWLFNASFLSLFTKQPSGTTLIRMRATVRRSILALLMMHEMSDSAAYSLQVLLKKLTKGGRK